MGWLKQKSLSQYNELYNSLSNYDKELLDSFFIDVNTRFILNKKDKDNIILDYKKIIAYFLSNNYEVIHIIEILDLEDKSIRM